MAPKPFTNDESNGAGLQPRHDTGSPIRGSASAFMLLQRYSAALGLAAIIATSALPLAANDTSQFPFARLGPPDAPVKLYTVERGEGPPVLLIHGFGTNSFTWRHV